MYWPKQRSETKFWGHKHLKFIDNKKQHGGELCKIFMTKEISWYDNIKVDSKRKQYE